MGWLGIGGQMKLSTREYRDLRWAVNEAEAWKGYFVGNPDPQPLLAFEEKVRLARRVLKKLSPNKKERS